MQAHIQFSRGQTSGQQHPGASHPLGAQGGQGYIIDPALGTFGSEDKATCRYREDATGSVMETGDNGDAHFKISSVR